MCVTGKRRKLGRCSGVFDIGLTHDRQSLFSVTVTYNLNYQRGETSERHIGAHKVSLLLRLCGKSSMHIQYLYRLFLFINLQLHLD